MPVNQIKAPMKSGPAAPGGAFGAPEEKRGKRRKTVSEYKKSLQEKQSLKELYGLSEKQCKRYVKEALKKMQRVENVSDELVKVLEKRLDNVVFRLGFAQSRSHARQMVSHSYFLMNGRPVNVPSLQVKKGDVISLKATKKGKTMFKDLPANLKKTEPHPWLSFDKEKMEAKVAGEPSMAEVNLPVEISLIFEFYSR